MLNAIVLLLLLAPGYVAFKRWREWRVDKMLVSTLGDDFNRLDESTQEAAKPNSWWRKRFDIVNEFYTPDFILIFTTKRVVTASVITFGYVCFVWFVCLTVDASFITGVIGTGAVLFVAFIVIYQSYKDAFSNYFESQFPYALRLISRNLAVGQTLYTSVDAAALNLTSIMQREFKRISSQLKSGMSFDEILDKGETIYPYKGYFVFSSYLKVSLQKGSSLRDTLLSLADDLISAQIIKKKTRALTSESRGAAVILAFLPVVMLIVMWLFNKANLYYLFSATYGRYVIIYVVCSVSIGFFIIANMIKKVEL